jgi:TrmH family RNA methyltransferase
MAGKIIRIRSANADFQRLEVLRSNRNKRHRCGEFLVEGVRNLNEATKNGWKFTALIYAEGVPLSDWAKSFIKSHGDADSLVLSPELMRSLSGKTDTSELMATIHMRTTAPSEIKLSERPLLMLFDRPSNRGNLGSVLRSCDGFGADGLIVTGHSVDLYDPEVVTASMGSFFNVPFARVDEAAALDAMIADMRAKYDCFTVVGTTAHNAVVLDEVDFTAPTLLILGNETEGMSRHCYDMCDTLATIPMAPSSCASSFNAACAATVMLYECARQRRFAGRK